MAYTVFDSNDSSRVYGSGLTASEAAAIVLTDDGAEYEIRPTRVGGGYQLWTKSLNSRWESCPFFSAEFTEDDAFAEIADKILKEMPRWRGRHPAVWTDEAFAGIQAEFEREQALLEADQALEA